MLLKIESLLDSFDVKFLMFSRVCLRSESSFAISEVIESMLLIILTILSIAGSSFENYIVDIIILKVIKSSVPSANTSLSIAESLLYEQTNKRFYNHQHSSIS